MLRYVAFHWPFTGLTKYAKSSRYTKGLERTYTKACLTQKMVGHTVPIRYTRLYMYTG